MLNSTVQHNSTPVTMLTITNVAIMGASGDLGQVLVPALLKAGFEVTAISRPNGTTVKYPGVTVKTAAYDNIAGLASALRGQHAVIEAFNPAAASSQSDIVQASIAAGVAHLITPEFSTNSFNEHADDMKIFEPKRRAQRELEAAVSSSDGAISWTAVIVGGWYDWAIEKGKFWIDRKAHSVTRFGSGNQKYSISRLALSGDAVVAVLMSPDQYRNRPAYFASHTISTNEMIALLAEIGHDEWHITDIPIEGFMKKALELWDQDTANGVTNRLQTDAYRMLGDLLADLHLSSDAAAKAADRLRAVERKAAATKALKEGHAVGGKADGGSDGGYRFILEDSSQWATARQATRATVNQSPSPLCIESTYTQRFFMRKGLA
ncbi:hypothetical protein V501_03939 [Pseudogymnoascus sp. VKM F-4519 (FW-2642)]|nr:hypothetical protein V501_03939 [Pseudogymnoascus sp. VKM F-4519 (FW-2642)]